MTEYPFHRFSTLAVAAFLVSLALSDSPARLTLKDAEAAQKCDCSCEVFTAFKSRMQEMGEAVKSGESAAAMTPELQQAAACAGQCAMQWAQCKRGDTAGTASAPEGGMNTETDSASATSDEAPAATESRTQADKEYTLGEPRDDLERFYGLYGDGSGKNFFVTRAKRPEYAEKQIPPGYLMIGAMWGDVAPWYMKSVSETRFEQQWVNPASEPVIAEFELDSDGDARAIIFETVFADRGRLTRVGNLPEGW